MQYLTTDTTKYYPDEMPWTNCDFVKSGAGSAFFCSTNALKFRSLQVSEGVLSLAGYTDYTMNKFWRFTVKATATPGNVLFLGPMRLYNRDGAFCDGGATSAWGAYSLYYMGDDNAPAVKDLQPLSALFSANAKDYNTNPGSGSDLNSPPWFMFADATTVTCKFNSLKPKINDPSSWMVVSYRIPNNAAPVTGYDLRVSWASRAQYPGAWRLETSPSGVDGTWEIIDEKSGQSQPTGQAWYHGGNQGSPSKSPYPITVMNDQGGGFNPAMNVQVDGGATLDCTRCVARQTLAAITVDVALGGGTLKNVQLAATGKLYLTNYSGKSGVELPLAFVDSVTTGSLEGWTVYVNGVENPKFSLAWQDGQLVIPRLGMMIILK